MTLVLTQSATAVGPSITASFLGVGGSGSPVYSVLPGGAGGTIDASTGVYTAPNTVSPDPVELYDTIQVDDGGIATAQILVGTPLLLFCDILQRELGLANGRVYLWDQKIMQPSDSDLYIAVSVPLCRPFSNVNRPDVDGSDLAQAQVVNMLATVDIDIISRGPAARDRKEEVILALNSVYAQKQQEANSFYVGKIPPHGGFRNLSDIDGAAIPYRYKITVLMQYAFFKMRDAPYMDNFETVDVVTNP